MPVADLVVQRLEALITDGILKPGQALPSERSLSARLDASRAAIREGLRALRARGLIETTHGRGSIVASLVKRAELPPLMRQLQSRPETLYDLFEVRQMLEAESARLAALRGTRADFARITRRYEEMQAPRSPATSAATLAQRDHAFHAAICAASHNPVLVHTLSSLADLLLTSVFASVNNLYHREEDMRVIDRQHARLYKAILARDSEQARRLAGAHIDTVI
ncbi:MAG: transcriptional regulator GlcC, partial [Burkholderiales bacterium 66-5]